MSIESDRLPGMMELTHNARYARFEDSPTRQLAYQLWASQPDKPITEWIGELDAAAGGKVALRSVQRWRHDDNWERRLAEEVLAASGVSVFEQVRRLRVAALPAIRYLDSVARGEENKPDRTRIEVCKFLVQQSAAVHQLAAGMPGTPSAPTISESDLLALETPWTPEEQDTEAPD